jgi:tRNA-(MS[2]IO[6]A)-hydroxylase (MiaE)-like
VPPSPEKTRDAVVELLGVLGYGVLIAFDRLAADARLAPDLRRRALLSEMAAAEMAHYGRITDRLVELGIEPQRAMAPFVGPLDDFHDSTRPNDWLEGLVKAYVGDGIADDFYREVAAFLAEPDRTLVLEVLHDTRQAEFAVAEVRAAIAADPARAGRLALWARRLVGEAISQAQRVAAERDALSALLAGGVDRPGLDLAAIGRMFTRITERHAARMEELGLAS